MKTPPRDCPVHKSLQPFTKLLGEWEGEGYMSLYTPTRYPCSEHISIGHIGQPSFTYSSMAHSQEAFRHRDMGFFFFTEATQKMQFMVSDNTGHVCIMTGTPKVDSKKIEMVLETELCEGHPLPGKPQTIKVCREITLVDEDTLMQKVYIYTTRKAELTLHTDMVYKRSAM
uniref:DUF1794 domain-containing protein n=1 Tax=Mesocestoides corti TaxID=53468 RepID=A0A5K3ELV5_MESCO